MPPSSPPQVFIGGLSRIHHLPPYLLQCVNIDSGPGQAKELGVQPAMAAPRTTREASWRAPYWAQDQNCNYELLPIQFS